MNNLKNTEQNMMLLSRSTNLKYAYAYNDMVNVLKFKDITEHSNHCKIIKLLYDVKKRKYTYEGIAIMVGISDNALRRYRKLYVQLFEYYLELNSNKKVAC